MRAAGLLRLLAFIGPGVVVMLADTDAGSVVTAAQSGARYGYQLVLPQVAMIPILYSVQEITARLGLVTGRGQAALIRSVFGARWALPAAATLFVVCAGAMITEFAGVVGVGDLAGVPRWVSTTAVVATLTLLVLAGRYQRLVISLAGAWSIAESLGWHHSLNDSPRQAVGFYGLAVAGLGIGAVPVLVFPNLVALTIDIEVLNACLLPIVLGFLVALERRPCPRRCVCAGSGAE